jgi:uncharacterized protein YndB with AHSA1/START domain/uncharacterized damage-inducible protein DinB
MEAKTIETGTMLRLERVYSAPREAVFEALTEPALLAKWFAPSDAYEAQIDGFGRHAGGRYRIEMRHEGGNVHTAVGTIRDFDPPRRLSYTWTWEGGEMGETLVTWELNEVENGTQVILTHDRFPDDETRAHHMQGWLSIMVRLQSLFERGAAHLLSIQVDLNERLFRNALQGVSRDDFTAHMNDRTNSMHWVAGHLAWSLGAMTALTRSPVDVGMDVFKVALEPGTSVPEMDAIRDSYSKAAAALRAGLAKMSAADLARPLPEGAPEFPVSEQTVAGGLAFLFHHQGYHIGQLAFLRKGLGYEALSFV